MEYYINQPMLYKPLYLRGMRQTTVQRPPVIMTPAKSTYVKLYGIMCATINACMSKYKHNMNDLEYLYCMQFLIDVIRDEIDGYVKHHYSRVPSSSAHSFARFVENEFQALVAPICDKIVRKEFNKEKRKAIITHYNKELQHNGNMNRERGYKVSFNMAANTFHVFEREEQ